jgi:hypothetical protein
MSDLRPWSEEDATAEELSLLEVARRRRALPSQRAAVLSALGVGVTTGAVSAAGIAGVGTKLVGLALLASMGVGVAVWHTGYGKPAVAVTPSTPRAVAPIGVTSAETTAPSLQPSSAPPELALAPAEGSAKVVAKLRPASAPSSSLSRELEVLKQAHDALARGNPNGALAALDDYHARFPQGALGAEETVIRVRALLARGDRARATAIAHQFSTAHPDSLYARRVELLVSELH